MYHPASASDSEEYDEHESRAGSNPALALVQHPQVALLRSMLDESRPYCCGTVEVPLGSGVLFYGKDEQSRRVDLLSASRDALDALEQACDSATFGVDQRNVLDESYRKAGKLDKGHFSINLDITHLGLLDVVRTGLFTGKGEKKTLRAELYKLNVYGKDSFFKSHKDTPRGADMFGSLVVIFPTPYEGGALILRHGGAQWAFDSAQLLASVSNDPPRIAYAAFFSDVEHEVARVTSGHRITVTYNLYFVDESASAQAQARFNIIQPHGANKPQVQRVLSALLDDPTFLPGGGTLGFGLRHLYPLPTSFDPHEDSTLVALRNRLKGADAALLRACTERGLTPALFTLYQDDQQHADGGAGRKLVAFSRVVKLDTHDLDNEEDQPLWAKLCRNFDGFLINPPAAAGGAAQVRSRTVHWVTPVSEVNRVKTRFAAYGNEPMMGYLYQRICLLVDVGPAGHRDLALEGDAGDHDEHNL